MKKIKLLGFMDCMQQEAPTSLARVGRGILSKAPNDVVKSP